MSTKLSFLAITLLTLALSLLKNTPTKAATPIPAELNLGFFQADAAEIPSAVKNQLKFIYRLTAPYFSTVNSKNYEALLSSPNTHIEIKNDIIHCQKAKLQSCVIHFGKIQGSAFLDENGSSIWTNCHIVHQWIEYRKQSLILAGTPDSSLLKELLASAVPFTLTDTNGIEIFSNEKSGNATLEALAVSNLKDPKNLSCSLQDDAVKIQLPSPLAISGIKRTRAKPPLSLNQTIFIGGNPRSTTTRSALGKEDSDGEHFYWTNGIFLAKNSAGADKYFSGRLNYGFTLSNPYVQTVLSDSAEGMSGGPALNAQGELVGIYKGLIPLDQTEKDIPLVSLFLDTGGMRYIEIFSESL